MLFQSQFYVLVFLPTVAALYYAVANSISGRQWLLVAASLIFYGWWDVRFVVLPVAQIAATWLVALAHERTAKREFLLAGVILNLVSLGTFKYLDFLLVIFYSLIGFAFPPPSTILPFAISFFSSQLFSYLIDLMRANAPIYPSLPFALFVLLYPPLIAAPIVR